MIKTFRSKALKRYFLRGETRGIRSDLVERLARRVDVLDAATDLDHLNLPGFDFHGLQGKPKRYSIHVDGNWYLTFEWEDSDALRVDLEDYH